MTELTALQRDFQTAFPENHTPPLFFSAPGRTELGGNHSDHQHGRILAAAVDCTARAAAAPAGGKQLRLFSRGFAPAVLSVDDLSPRQEEQGQPLALLRGVAAWIAARGYSLGGLDLCVRSQIPVGGGLSSSAAFEVLLGAVFNRFFCQNALTPLQLAQAGQFAENVYFGKPCGLMDQLVCAYGGLLYVDFADPDSPLTQALPFSFSSVPYALCVIDSGCDHSRLTADFAAIPAEMRQVAAYFGKTVLREVPEAEFWDALPQLRQAAGDRACLRAAHFFEENRRLPQQAAALQQGDFTRFLKLVNASGRCSWMYLQNVIAPSAVLRQELAVTLALCRHLLQDRGACRVHGGGFAGTVQAYVPLEQLPAFRQSMERALGRGCLQQLSLRREGAGEDSFL